MPQDPSTDPDFLKASPSDQLAYLRATDKDFAAASPQDQLGYLGHVTGMSFGNSSAASPIPAPPIQRPSVNMQPVELDTGQPAQPDRVLQHLKQMAIGAGQNLGQISTPGIAASLLNRFRPGTQLPASLQGATKEALPLNQLPEQMVMTTLPSIAGGLDEPTPAAQTVRPTIRQNSSPAPVETPSINPLVKMLTKRIPGVGTFSDAMEVMNYYLKQQNAPVAPPPPTPGIPETGGIPWGSGGQGPLDLRGRMIPQPDAIPTVRQNSSPTQAPAAATSPAATGRGPTLSAEKVSVADRPPTPEEAANNQRFLAAFKKATAGRETPNAETSIPHDIETAQQKVFFNKDVPDIDVGNKIREANPEPTRAEVAAAQAKNIPAGNIAKPVGGPPTDIKMQPAQSTTIAAHGYDPASRTMQVQFKNGSVYQHSGVPQEIYNNYQNAESQGSYHQQNIKGRYETRLVGKVAKNK